MMLNGQTSPTTYGRLLDWSLREEAQNLMRIGIGDQPGEGLVTLEIQEKTLRFLVECAEIILHDLLPFTESSTSVPQSFPPPTSHHTDTEWPSVAAVVAETPYQVPKQFDFSGIRSLVIAKRAEAEDHIWSLREDPGYFQDAVSEWGEHRWENLLDLNGKRHPDLNKAVFWENVLDCVVTDAYSNLVMWDLAEKELSYIVKLREQYGSRINPNQRMPADYEIALCHFRNLVERMRFAPLTIFQQGISSSPPLRKYYRRKQLPDGRVTVVVLPDKRRDDYLLWLIERFRTEGHVELYGLSELLDELERVTRSNSVIAGAPQMQYISPWIATALSGLAVVGELERQLNLHQPPILRSLPEKELDGEFDKRTALNDVIFKAGRRGKFADAGTPLTKFTYPAGKRRTASTTAKQREAEKNLDAFWQTVDKHYARNLGKSLHELLSGILVPRELDRTPEWVEPTPSAEPEKPGSSSAITANSRLSSLKIVLLNTLRYESLLNRKSKLEDKPPNKLMRLLQKTNYLNFRHQPLQSVNELTKSSPPYSAALHKIPYLVKFHGRNFFMPSPLLDSPSRNSTDQRGYSRRWTQPCDPSCFMNLIRLVKSPFRLHGVMEIG